MFSGLRGMTVLDWIQAAPRIAVILLAAWCVATVIRLVLAGPDKRASITQGWRVRHGWRRLARMLELRVEDPTPTLLARFRHRGTDLTPPPREILPALRIRADRYGLVIDTRTLPKVGRKEWAAHAEHLADAWRCTRVAITQTSPGRLRIRAVRVDPLIAPTSWTPTGAVPTAQDYDSWLIGVDEYAAPVRVRIRDVPGVSMGGLPGSGKTSLNNGLLARYAPAGCVQFAFLDGKGAGDYDDMAPRAFAFVGDDLGAAHDLLLRLVEIARRRAEAIRRSPAEGGLGVKNFWHVGPTQAWPWIVVIIDEAHTYFAQVRDGGNKELRERNSLASQNVLLVEHLVKKCRSLGFLVVLATQKPTADAIPTQIRDICPVQMSFAQTTTAAAVASLGEGIREWPDADPTALQGAEYVGCAVMRVEGRVGFTRVRLPYVTDADVARIATDTAHLTRDPAELLGPRLVVIEKNPPAENDQGDQGEAA